MNIHVRSVFYSLQKRAIKILGTIAIYQYKFTILRTKPNTHATNAISKQQYQSLPFPIFQSDFFSFFRRTSVIRDSKHELDSRGRSSFSDLPGRKKKKKNKKQRREHTFSPGWNTETRRGLKRKEKKKKEEIWRYDGPMRHPWQLARWVEAILAVSDKLQPEIKSFAPAV